MQGTETGPRSSRFTRDQAYDPLQRTSSNVAQQALLGATGKACSPAAGQVQPFSGIQHTQPEAGDRKLQVPCLLEIVSRLGNQWLRVPCSHDMAGGNSGLSSVCNPCFSLAILPSPSTSVQVEDA